MQTLSDIVADCNDLLSSRGIAFTLIILPYRNELRRNHYDRIDQLKEFAVSRRIHVIDTRPYLYEKYIRHDSRLEALYWPVDHHFTELGYRYFAEAVNQGLKERAARSEQVGH